MGNEILKNQPFKVYSNDEMNQKIPLSGKNITKVI